MAMGAGLAQAVLRVPERPIHPVRYQRIFLLVGMLLAGVQAYTARYYMGADGISYVDVALAYVRHDWSLAVSSYWSPMYSWVLGLGFAIVPATPRTEYPIVHAVNWICFVFTFWRFHRFWQTLTERSNEMDGSDISLVQENPSLWDTLGYGLFLYLFVPLVATVTPDLLAAGFVFLIAEQALKLGTNAFLPGKVITRSMALAGAYLAKSILLYLGFGVLLVALLLRIGNRRVIASCLVFFIALSGSWVFVLHHFYGKWTVGASGGLNYAWFVNGTETGFVLDPQGPSMPYFSGEKAPTVPPVFRVQTHPNVTFIPWFDPARFDPSRKPTFSLGHQVSALSKNLRWLRGWFLIEFGPITVVCLGVLFTSGRGTLSRLKSMVVVLAPVAGLFGLYALVFVRSYRYIAAPTILLYAVLFSVGSSQRVRATTKAGFVLAGLLIFAAANLPGTIKGVLSEPPNAKEEVAAAEVLKKKGIDPNTKVGLIGTGERAYLAQLARLTIASDLFDGDEHVFWAAPEVEKKRILCQMKLNGSEFVIGRAPEGLKPTWEDLADGYKLLDLRNLLNCQT